MYHYISRILQQPRQVMLLDACGACLTAFGTGLIALLYTNPLMPRWVLPLLPVLAAALACFSFYQYRQFGAGWRKKLLVIVAANTGYAVFTTAMLVVYGRLMNGWVFTYFVLELFVLALLVWLELTTARQRKAVQEGS